MFATRLFQLLLVALSITTAAQAAWMENELMPQMDKKNIVVKRQASGTGGNTPPPSSTPTPSPSDDPPSSNPPSSTPTRTSPPPSSTPPNSTPPSSTSDKAPEPTEETVTEVRTTTNSDGKVQTYTTETKTTRTPGLSNDGSSGSSGMSTTTRNTIIGVVVGIGGAIILGALAFVAFRVRGRKKAAEENDGLMNYSGGYSTYTGGDAPGKSEVGSSGGTMSSRTANNPFQQTLETYHAPTHVNPSANF